jgi:hypothetical protein
MQAKRGQHWIFNFEMHLKNGLSFPCISFSHQLLSLGQSTIVSSFKDGKNIGAEEPT